jgi:nitronate monooxygenase
MESLGIGHPVLAAPMSGGPTTPAMVTAAARAGSMGFLAGGYKSADLLSEQIEEVRRSGSFFGVNLFAPNPIPVDPAAFRTYARLLQPDADPYQLDLAGASIVEDDDHWRDKVDLLRTDPVPVVSFTFGVPDAGVVKDLQRAGSRILQTVTSPEEALRAQDVGVDGLVVQGGGAGGHSATTAPSQPPARRPLDELVRTVTAVSRLPVLAAGGVGSAGDVATLLASGAEAVLVGTLLLLTEESGASVTYQQALASREEGPTVVTRAFSGRPAGALPNRFTEQYGANAPLGYPAIHHLTTPLRRAAAVAGDAELINLWAGSAFHLARPESTTDTLLRLAGRL